MGYIECIITVLAGIYGLVIGSFLNVVIYRVPNNVSMLEKRSFCPKCRAKIHWYDNIPLFSYIFLGGRCRSCKEPISVRYPIVEALNMIGWILSFVVYQDNPIYAGICCVAISTGICIFMIDLEHMIIFDRFQIILLVLGVLSIFFDKTAIWYSHLIGFAVGLLSFWGIGAAVGHFTGKDALGGGDVKLFACMGLILGLPRLLLSALIASVGACIVIFISRAIRKDGEGCEYPFAPYLVTGLIISMLFGNYILNWYFGLLM